MKIRIGCSGWNYKDWKGKFYPEEIPKKDWLKYYVQYFNTVEVNGTFYNFPKEKTLGHWYEATPFDFGFTLKGSRYITHMKKLNDVEESVDRFYNAANFLKEKLQCILWQLPPNLHRDDQKLKYFCEALDQRRNNVIEFRHTSWFDSEVYKILEDNNITFCTISSPDFPEELIQTGKNIYVRFHGKGEKWYDYDYSKKELKKWADKINATSAEKYHLYFNNDYHANAARNAIQMKEMLNSYKES